jgi:NADPH:quinone reductase-like Zn-dependent oxidoreductase
VLIQAAAGGVGIAATQIARLAGAGEVYGTASPSKHDAIRGFGVDHAIDYTKGDFAKEVRRIAGSDQPLDIVMDAIGGRSFRRSWSLLGAGGRLVCFGATSIAGGERRSIPRALKTMVEMPPFFPVSMMSQSKSVIGLNMLKLWDAKGSLDEYVGPLLDWTASGRLRPVVAEAFPLEKDPDAHRYIAERKNVGKVVLTL